MKAALERPRHWVYKSLLGSSALALVLIVAGIAIAAFGEAGTIRLVTNFFITLLIVLGYQIFTGNSGIVSFGHIAFMAIGAYASALLTIPPATKGTVLSQLPEVLATAQLGIVEAFLIALMVVGVIAVLVGIPLVRLSGSAGAIATFAFLVIVNVVLSGWTGVTGGRRALYGVPIYTRLGLSIGLATIGLVIARVLRDSRVGLQLRASREDEVAAQTMGVSVERVRLIAWMVSALFVGASGVLYAHFIGAFSPQQFYLVETINVLAMLIVGGMTTTSGAVVGTVVMTIAFEVLRNVETSAAGISALPDLFGIAQIFVGFTLLFVMYFRPEGLLGRWELDEIFLRRFRRRSRGAEEELDETPDVSRSEGIQGEA
jgi:branched-chain amino acid transport system permease protein